MSGSAKEGRRATVGFIFFGVSRLMMGVPFVPNENRTRRPPLLLPPSFFLERLAAGVDVGDADDVVGGGLFPTTTTGSIFSSLIFTVGIRFLFAASVSSDEMVLAELGGIVLLRGAASGAKSDSGTNVDGEEGGFESLLLLLLIELIILLVLGGELFRAEAAASTPVGADDDGVFGSVSVAGWSCDDERKASTVVCVRALSSFMMCSSKRGCRNPRFEKRC